MTRGKELKRDEGERSPSPLTFLGPELDVIERAGSFVVEGSLPGFEEKDVDVKVEDGVLAIRGERRAEREENDEGWYSSERSYSSFERRFPLPEDVDTNACNVRFVDGILEVTLPKRQ